MKVTMCCKSGKISKVHFPKDMEGVLENACPLVSIQSINSAIVRTDGMTTRTSWFLWRGRQGDGWGSLEGKCKDKRFCIRNRQFLWQWYDEMDANSYKEGGSAVEGWVDIWVDDFPRFSNFFFTVSWKDNNEEEVCFECK